MRSRPTGPFRGRALPAQPRDDHRRRVRSDSPIEAPRDIGTQLGCEVLDHFFLSSAPHRQRTARDGQVPGSGVALPVPFCSNLTGMVWLMPSSDVALVLARLDELALEPSSGSRGWKHMGAVVADAALQAGVTYRTTVLPRVRKLVADWPEAITTSGFVERMRTDDVATALDWKPDSKKMTTLRDLADLLIREQVETTEDLQQALGDEGFRSRLRAVKGIGPKTVDYLAILTGSTEHVAVDSQLRAFVRDAGVSTSDYDEVRKVITDAAAERGWDAGAMDAAIWAHQSGAT